MCASGCPCIFLHRRPTAHPAQATTAGQGWPECGVIAGHGFLQDFTTPPLSHTAQHSQPELCSVPAVCCSLSVQLQLSPWLHSFLHFALLSSVPPGPALPHHLCTAHGNKAAMASQPACPPVTLLSPPSLLLLWHSEVSSTIVSGGRSPERTPHPQNSSLCMGRHLKAAPTWPLKLWNFLPRKNSLNLLSEKEVGLKKEKEHSISCGNVLISSLQHSPAGGTQPRGRRRCSATRTSPCRG